MDDSDFDEIVPPDGFVSGVATTFADPADLRKYRAARRRGLTEQQALAVGDNGLGYWGDDTTRPEPIIALPRDHPAARHNQRVAVIGPTGRPVVARVADVLPKRANIKNGADIDLNPAAARAVGATSGKAAVAYRVLPAEPADDTEFDEIVLPANGVAAPPSQSRSTGLPQVSTAANLPSRALNASAVSDQALTGDHNTPETALRALPVTAADKAAELTDDSFDEIVPPESLGHKALVGIGQGIDAVRGFINEAAPGFLEQLTTSPFPATNLQPNKSDALVTSIGKAAANQVTGLIEGLTSPAMVATASAGGIVPALAKPITAAFLADTVRHLPAALEHVNAVYNDPNSGIQERAEADLNLAGLLAISHQLGRHALAKPGTAASTTEPTDAPDVQVPAAERLEDMNPMGRSALEKALLDAGVSQDGLSGIATVPQAMEILSERRKAMAEAKTAADQTAPQEARQPSPSQEPSTQPLESLPQDHQPSDPLPASSEAELPSIESSAESVRPQRDPSEIEAQRQYEADLLREAEEAQQISAVEGEGSNAPRRSETDSTSPTAAETILESPVEFLPEAETTPEPPEPRVITLHNGDTFTITPGKSRTGREVFFIEDSAYPGRQSQVNKIEDALSNVRTASRARRTEINTDTALEAEAQRQYEADLLREAEEAQGNLGPELHEAIIDAGGLPSKASPHRETYASEIRRIESAVRNPARGEKLQANKLFREDAPDLDELATRLRDRGFEIDTPGDLLGLVEDRYRTGRQQYGISQNVPDEQLAYATKKQKPIVLKNLADLPTHREETRPQAQAAVRPNLRLERTEEGGSIPRVQQASNRGNYREQPASSPNFERLEHEAPSQSYSNVASPAQATLPRRIQNVAQPALPSSASGTPRPLADIRKYLSTALDIPVRLGVRAPGGMRGAFGLYRVKPQTIRLKMLNDIPTLAHEIGHDLHHIVFDNPATGQPQRWAHAFDNELIPLGRVTSGPNYSLDQVRMEGVAEFAREWMTDRAAAIAKAPAFAAHFETTLRGAHPEIHQILETARADIANYINAPGWEKAKSMIVAGDPQPPRSTVGEWLERQYTAWFDELRPIQRMTRKLVELGYDPKSAAEVSARFTNYKGGWRGKADHDLRFEQTDLNGARRGKGLHEILGGIENVRDWDTYVALKRAQEKQAQGFKTGFEDALADPSTHQKLRDLAPLYEARRQDFIKFSDGLMQNMQESGYFTDAQMAAMRAANRDYVPFHRIYETITGESVGPAGGGAGFVNTASAVKRFKGSDLQIASPTEAIIKNNYLFRDLAERNRAARMFVDAVEQTTGSGRVAESVLKPMKPTKISHEEMIAKLKDIGLGAEADKLTKAGVDLAHTIFRAADGVNAKDGTFRIWKDGQEKLYQLGDAELLRALTLMDTDSASTWTKILKPFRKVTAMLRSGATLSPDFIVRNWTRDQLTAAPFSQYGFVPFYDGAKGIFSAVGKDHWYRDWIKSGGSNSGIVESGARNTQEALAMVLHKDPGALRTALQLANPLNVLKNLRRASEIMEEGTRIGEFRRAIEAGASPLEAANAAKDVSLNFSRWGRYGKAINSISAFFNAGLQDIDKVTRAHLPERRADGSLSWARPRRTALKATMYVTTPSVLAWYLGKDDDRIQKLPDWRKSFFWNFNLGNAGDADGFVLSVPKPFLMGAMYGTSAERALDYISGRDPNAINKWGHDLLQNTFLRADLVVAANVFKPLVENLTNYSLFTGRQLVNEGQQQLEKRLQFNPQTSEVSKVIGPLLNTSPIMIDNLVRGYTGGLGMAGTDAIDWFLVKTGLVNTPPAPAKSVRELPGVRAFFGSPYATSEYVPRFYKAMDEAERRLRSYNAYGQQMMTAEQQKFWQKNRNELVWYNAGTSRDPQNKSTVMTELRRTRDAISDVGKSMVAVQQDRNLSPEIKRQRLIQLRDMRDKLAEGAFKTYVHPTDRFKVY